MEPIRGSQMSEHERNDMGGGEAGRMAGGPSAGGPGEAVGVGPAKGPAGAAYGQMGGGAAVGPPPGYWAPAMDPRYGPQGQGPWSDPRPGAGPGAGMGGGAGAGMGAGIGGGPAGTVPGPSQPMGPAGYGHYPPGSPSAIGPAMGGGQHPHYPPPYQTPYHPYYGYYGAGYAPAGAYLHAPPWADQAWTDQAGAAQQAAGMGGQGRRAGMSDLVDEISNGGSGLASLGKILDFNDADFWKGALVGAAAVLLLTNESVQGWLLGLGAKAKGALGGSDAAEDEG